ncbi:glycosyltransferase family 1 protein, partial [Escherichia coli]|nr:glycosyltransferase family 1 protein [Escherichia coli]
MGDKKFIGTIHGLREIECPGDFYEYKYRKGIISVTKAIIRSLVIPKCVRVRRVKENISKIFAYKNLKIITVSQHSKYSILANFPEIKSEQIIVIDSPYEFQAKKANDKNSLEKGNSYFLLVSGNRWVKNSYRAIQA